MPTFSQEIDTLAIFQQIAYMNFDINNRNIWTLRDLAYFVAISEQGQLLLAAQRLGVTQPALTKSVKRLESEIGCALFMRTPRGLVLTQAGSLLLAHVKKIHGAVGEARRHISDFTGGVAGHLRIGVGPTLTEYLLPTAISRLLQLSPKVSINIVEAMNDVLSETLIAGELDLAVSALPDVPPSGVHQEQLIYDEMVVIAAVGHPLSRARSVPLEALAMEKWVLPPERVLSRRWLEQVFESHGLNAPNPAVVTDSGAMLREIVASTTMVSFRPTFDLEVLGFKKRICGLKVPALRRRRPIGVSYLDGAYLPPVAHKLVSILHEVAAGNTPSN